MYSEHLLCRMLVLFYKKADNHHHTSLAKPPALEDRFSVFTIIESSNQSSIDFNVQHTALRDEARRKIKNK